MSQPFPFIVGCGRSGSTLLRVMLDAHPDMVIPPESYFLEPMLRRRDGFVGSEGFNRSGFERELFADSRFRNWGLDPMLVVEELDRAAPDDLASATRSVYRAMARASGGIRYADKTPSYAMCIPEVASLFAESVFIHLIRDPRDVAASYRSAGWGPRSLTSAGIMWNRRAGAARAAGERLGPSRYIDVHYERLVADPGQELNRICDFIQLTFDPDMLAYESNQAARATATLDGGAHLGLLERPTVGLRDWRVDLSSKEAARVGSVTDRLAMELGYAGSPRCVGPNRLRSGAERAGALLEALSLRFRRTRIANVLRRPWRVLRGRAAAVV